MNKFVLYNGKFILKENFDKSLLGVDEYLFTEELRSIRNELISFSNILKIIQLEFSIYNIPTPHLIQNDGKEIRRQIERFLAKNKLFKSAILKLSFFNTRDGINYFLEATQLDETEYILNKSGLKVDLFDKLQKPIGSLSNLSIGSKLIWDIAKQHLRETNFDNLLIINNDNKIIEAIGKNTFIIKGTKLYSINPTSGAYIDVITEIILKIASSIELEVKNLDGFTENELMEADEIFLASLTNGIEWVMAYKSKRYYNSIVKKLLKKLNELIINSEKDSPDN